MKNNEISTHTDDTPPRRYRGPSKKPIRPDKMITAHGEFDRIIAKIIYYPEKPRKSGRARVILNEEQQKQAFKQLENYMHRHQALIACNPKKTIYFIKMKDDSRFWTKVVMFVDRIGLVITKEKYVPDIRVIEDVMEILSPPPPSKEAE